MIRKALAALCLVGVIPVGHAATLQDIVALVLSGHPDLARWEAQRAAAIADVETLDMAPPLVLVAETETPLGADHASDLGSTEGTVLLSRVIELGDKRGHRAAAGRSRLSRAELELELRRAELMAETSKRFNHVLAAQVRMSNAEAYLDLVERLRDGVERQVAAARLSEAEQFGARMEVDHAQARRLHARGELAAARAGLLALWGGDDARFGEAEGDLFRLGRVPAPAAALAAAESSPELVRLRAERAVAEAQTRLTRSTAHPDLTLAAGAKYFGELDAGGVSVGISMPLGARSRAAPATRAATRREEAAAFAIEAYRRQLQGAITGLVKRLAATREELAEIREGVIPNAEQAVDAYRRGFEAGRHSFAVVAVSQRSLLEAHEDAVRIATEFHDLMVELALLTRADSTRSDRTHAEEEKP